MYLTIFKSLADVIAQYEAPADALDGATVHLAWYGYGSYEGSSFVLYEKDGKLFEVNGNHCSGYGLEGQWEPEQTTWEALKVRRLDGSFKGAWEAREVLAKLINEHLPSAEAVN